MGVGEFPRGRCSLGGGGGVARCGPRDGLATSSLSQEWKATLVPQIDVHTAKHRHDNDELTYACTNGTRHGLRMTLSSKCSGVCIVIPVECRRAGCSPLLLFLLGDSRRFLALAPTVHPSAPFLCPYSHPYANVTFVFVAHAAARRTRNASVSAICFAMQTRCRSTRPSIKCNNITMNAHAAPIISYAFA